MTLFMYWGLNVGSSSGRIYRHRPGQRLEFFGLGSDLKPKPKSKV